MVFLGSAQVLVDNGQPGKITKERRAGEWAGLGYVAGEPRLQRIARTCGALAIKVTDPSQLDDAIARGLAHPGPALIHVVANPDLV
jgi:thiamine pyrophosphate-dependent acetolactate synthase large subunit-like protein